MHKKLANNCLIAGMRLPGAVFDERGKFLFPAGRQISTKDMESIRAGEEGDLYGDEHWPWEFLQHADRSAATESATAFRVVRVEDLAHGMRLPDDVYDAESDVLLLAAGAEITPRFLQLLRARGIKTIRTRTPDKKPGPPTAAHTALTRRLDALLRDELRKKTNYKPHNAHDRPRLRLEDFKAEASRGIEKHSIAADKLAEIDNTLSRGRTVSGAHVADTLRVYTEQVMLDIDLLPFIASNTAADNEYLFHHCVNSALISMSIAAQLGLARERIAEIGFGALLQDLGMLSVPPGIRLAQRKLTSEEMQVVRQHPMHTLKKLENVTDAPLNAGFIAYQSHERFDGKGYPRQQPDKSVLSSARIVGIADSFAAMTHDRPYRRAMLPYYAAREVLADVWKFDRSIVRTFLDTVGLFPIGSCVELNTGAHARVIRIVPGAHTRPVIEPYDNQGQPTGRLVNLVTETDLSVARVVSC